MYQFVVCYFTGDGGQTLLFARRYRGYLRVEPESAHCAVLSPIFSYT